VSQKHAQICLDPESPAMGGAHPDRLLMKASVNDKKR
jgi:hypothetical protein